MNTHELEKANCECEVGGESEEGEWSSGNPVVDWQDEERDLSKRNSEVDVKTAVIIVPSCLDICEAYQYLFSPVRPVI
jgi:hypothetical protein